MIWLLAVKHASEEPLGLVFHWEGAWQQKRGCLCPVLGAALALSPG